MKNPFKVSALSAVVLMLSVAGATAQTYDFGQAKVIKEIFEKVQAPINGGTGSYGYQSYTREAGIDVQGLNIEDLALEMEFYMDNIDDPGNLEIIDTAGFQQIELGNEIDHTKTYFTWSIRQLKADGKIRAGEWCPIRLLLSEANYGGECDFNAPLNYYRWCLAHISTPREPQGNIIRFRNVRVVDITRPADPVVEQPEYNTDYLAATIPFTMNGTLTGSNSGGFSIGNTISPAVNVANHDVRMLYLEFDAEITELTPGDINVLKSAPGQIELTSSGRPDVNELCFSLAAPDWKTGKHTYRLPFSTATFTGGAPDYANINYIRFYCVNIPSTVNYVTFKVNNVKIVDMTNATSLPGFFSNGMMFQQQKPMHLWGYSKNAGEITLKLYKNGELIENQTATFADGRWDASFAPQKASYDKYRIEVFEDGKVLQTIDDILVGELWVAGGQSNMELRVSSTQQAAELMAAADNDYIRFLYMPTYPYGQNEMPMYPTKDINGVYWGHGNNGTQVGSVSAVAYLAVKELQDKLGIPVGFLYTPIGGTVIEAWIPREELDENQELVKELKRIGLYCDEDFWVHQTTTATSLYNQKVGPLAGMNVAGVIWYQGESNEDRPHLYAEEMTTMKRGWERTFNFEEGTMPLIFCQVCRWVTQVDRPQHLAYLDEGMFDAWNTSEQSRKTMAVLPLYDTDMSWDGNVVIHPTNKMPVGHRFATAMYNMVYAPGNEYTAAAPLYVKDGGDGSLIVGFNHVGDGLKTIDGNTDVLGFAICDERNVFVNARARIIGKDQVKVWSEGIANPTNVTYAFATYNFKANLANSEDIPATPFRSDRTIEATYFNPQDWMSADDATIWGISGNDAKWLDTWKGNNATMSFDTADKVEGKASMTVDYTKSKLVYFSPATTYSSVVLQVENYNYLTAVVKNPDSRSKSLQLTVIGKNNKKNECGTIEIPANADWHQVQFALPGVAAKELRFTIVDTEAGTLKVDNFAFGLDEATGIEDVVADINDGYYYDIYGRRFDSPTISGIYIHNNRKIVVRR